MFHCTREFFNLATKEFLDYKKSSYDGADRMLVPVLVAFSNFKHLDKIVPRWSCESHDKTKYQDYYIIFCSRNEEGTKLLYDMEAYLNSLYRECNKTSLEIVRLSCSVNGKTDRHITIKIKSTYGDLVQTDTAMNNWLKCIKFFNDR